MLKLNVVLVLAGYIKQTVMDDVLKWGVVFWHRRLMVWISVVWSDAYCILWSDCFEASHLSSLTLTDTRCASFISYLSVCCKIVMSANPNTNLFYQTVFIILFQCRLNILKKIHCWHGGITPQWYLMVILKLSLCTGISWPIDEQLMLYLACYRLCPPLCDVNLGNSLQCVYVCVAKVHACLWQAICVWYLDGDVNVWVSK